ncbi:putative reverse transcriptase domain-containing protein [Tanacetum coccineum]
MQDTSEIYMRLEAQDVTERLVTGSDGYEGALERQRLCRFTYFRVVGTAGSYYKTTTVEQPQEQAAITEMLGGDRMRQDTRDADRNTNGDDSHISGAGVRRTERTARELHFENQALKFATCTLHSVALTWWNTHVKTVGHDAAYGMPWKTLMKMMTDKYCPRNEIKKLEMEIWDLKVKGTDLTSYTQRLVKIALSSGRNFSEESIKLKNMTMAFQTIIIGVDREFKEVFRTPNNQQQQKQEAEHWSTTNDNNANNQKGTGLGQKPTCYECGVQGHFKRECPKLKNNNNRGNQVRGGNAPAKVSFVSTAFSSQIDITPTALDHYYDVELADRRIIGLNTILRGCTLNILNHPFNIDLMPVELGSFDAIIGMDWLVKYQAIIVCAEKIIRIPWGNETLIVHGDESNRGNEARLHIISYTKIQEYMLKGCLDFAGSPSDSTSGIFSIAWVIPGAAPVARAPYRLAPYCNEECLVDAKREVIAYASPPTGRCSRSQDSTTHSQFKRARYEARELLELLSDYDCEIRYHPGKANVVADTLSRKEREPPLRV